jgi:two-component system response regulator HydG/two-component system response regulator AtoC
MRYEILVVEDEISTLKVLTPALTKENFEVATALTAEDALEKIRKNHFDLVVTDYKLPSMSGEELLEEIKLINARLPVILITAYGSIDLAVNTMKKGAYTFLTKPVNLNLLVSTIKDALRDRDETSEDDIAESYQFLNIFGKSKGMREVFSMIQRISKTDASILILGESGTGKELVARAIHYTSLRADKPFIPIDCTTIPQELMESELFGYEKGAFTCAYNKKVGLLEMADGGTVFFDEIGDLEYGLQKKLLRFLQEREFHRVGGKKPIITNARVITATNKDLEEAVQNNEFRADLYYRLNVISINIPPLRERKEDIPVLAEHFLENFSKKNRKDIRGFEQKVQEIFMNYDWPGNVRELENVVERAVILCPFDSINIECLPNKLRSVEVEDYCFPDDLNLPEMEKRIIMKALEKTAWNQSQAARLLGISRKQLMTKMKNHGIVPSHH